MSGERPGMSSFPGSAEPKELLRSQQAMAGQLHTMGSRVHEVTRDVGRLESRVQGLEKTDHSFHEELTELKLSFGKVETTLKVGGAAAVFFLTILQVALTYWMR